MHKSLKIFLLSDAVRGIRCTYHRDQDETPAEWMKQEKPVADRVLFKTFDPLVQVGEFVAVATKSRHGVTICKVDEVDVEPDLDSDVPCEWILGRVDVSAAERHIEQERAALEAIASAEKAHRKRELRDKMLANVPEGAVLAISALPQNSPIEPAPQRPPDMPSDYNPL